MFRDVGFCVFYFLIKALACYLLFVLMWQLVRKSQDLFCKCLSLAFLIRKPVLHEKSLSRYIRLVIFSDLRFNFKNIVNLDSGHNLDYLYAF